MVTRSRLAHVLLPRVFWLSMPVALGLFDAHRVQAYDCGTSSRMGTCIDADTFWPHAGAARLQTVGSVESLQQSHFSFGLVTSYARKPIVLLAASADPKGTEIPAINHMVNTSFLWGFGVTERMALTLAMPITVYQNGTGTSAYASSQAVDVARTAMRDFRVGASYALLPRTRAFPGNPAGLVARVEVSAPVGDKDWFAGDRGFVIAPSVAADFRQGRWFAGAEIGGRFRSVANLAGSRVGSQALIAMGAGFDVVVPERLSVALEAFALPTLVSQERVQHQNVPASPTWESSGKALVPAEWMVTVRSAPTRDGDYSFSLSGGTAIPMTEDSAITAPQYRFIAGIRYAPLARDTDGDMVLDRDDLCPNEREDRDGFEDQDGCVDADNDKDGVADDRDRCRDKAEDPDGFQDDDGCPDGDDDGDGVTDAEDTCRFKAEDKDGFQDTDGCPDPDNDGDGILDKVDACPDAPEDRDGFNDTDGCPDPDNDVDKVPDGQDKCPNSREDIDGFQDDDGCPDPDNDMDGVLDADDKCPTEAENIDGVDDADGCPEAGGEERTVVKGASVAIVSPARFAPGKATLTPELRKQATMLAQRIRGMQPIEGVIIQTFADTPRQSPQNEKLADERASALRAGLVEAGLPSSVITAAVGDLASKRPADAAQYEIVVQRGVYK